MAELTPRAEEPPPGDRRTALRASSADAPSEEVAALREMLGRALLRLQALGDTTFDLRSSRTATPPAAAPGEPPNEEARDPIEPAIRIAQRVLATQRDPLAEDSEPEIMARFILWGRSSRAAAPPAPSVQAAREALDDEIRELVHKRGVPARPVTDAIDVLVTAAFRAAGGRTDDNDPERHIAEARRYGYSPDPWAEEIVALRAAAGGRTAPEPSGMDQVEGYKYPPGGPEDYPSDAAVSPAAGRTGGEPPQGEAMSKCELCGEPMPPGEEMYKYHGYSGPCPKPPTVAASPPVNASAELALLRANIGDLLDENVRLQAALSESEARAERARRALGEATELFAEVLGYFTRQVHPGESCWEAGFMYDAHRKQYYESLARLRTLAGGTESET